jgi:hypothetical protein
MLLGAGMAWMNRQLWIRYRARRLSCLYFISGAPVWIEQCLYEFFVIDLTPQIRLFVKLKVTKCAPIPGLPEIGFFHACASRVNPTCAVRNYAEFFV